MPEYDHLFITGCARSGTSAFAVTLGEHPKIAMGRERFAFRYTEDRHFPPSLFEKERFCRQLVPGDSHHRKLRPYYKDLYEKIDGCLYRGDKIPDMAQDDGPLLEFHERPRVIYMLRNIFDVAYSFNLRAADAREAGITNGWPWDCDAMAAVRSWNLSLQQTLAMRDRLDLRFVVFETAFADRRQLDGVLAWLGLEMEPLLAATFADMMTTHHELEGSRVSRLTSAEKLAIMKDADFASYQQALAIAESY